MNVEIQLVFMDNKDRLNKLMGDGTYHVQKTYKQHVDNTIHDHDY